MVRRGGVDQLSDQSINELICLSRISAPKRSYLALKFTFNHANNGMTQSIVYYGLGTIFTVGLAIVLFIACRQGRFSIPISKADVFRRSVIRLGFCTLPYLALAWLLSLNGNDVLFHGFWFWYAVILIPGLGLAFDLARPWATTKPNDRGV